MTQEITEDEVQGQANQLDLFRDESLREELDLIPAAEFASALGLAEQTLAGWRCNKQGPDFVKLGKTVFYRRVDLKEWIGKNVTAPVGA